MVVFELSVVYFVSYQPFLLLGPVSDVLNGVVAPSFIVKVAEDFFVELGKVTSVFHLFRYDFSS